MPAAHVQTLVVVMVCAGKAPCANVLKVGRSWIAPGNRVPRVRIGQTKQVPLRLLTHQFNVLGGVNATRTMVFANVTRVFTVWLASGHFVLLIVVDMELAIPFTVSANFSREVQRQQ